MNEGRPSSTRRVALSLLIGGMLLLSSSVLFDGKSVSAALPSVTYSSDTTLTGDVYCGNMTIEQGVTLTTNGYEIYCSGSFDNAGILDTGVAGNGGGSGTGSLSAPTSDGGGGGDGVYIQANAIVEGTIISAGGSGGTCTLQYCGGGGGGGGGLVLLAYGSGGLTNGTGYTGPGTAGSGVISITAPGAQPGGAGGATLSAGGSPAGCDTHAKAGLDATAPIISYNLLATWYIQGMSSYLVGGGGGGGAGADGAGLSGGSSSSSYGGGGGGGGSQCEIGAAGGAGLLLSFDYGTNPPIMVSSPITSSTSASKTSTSATAPPPWAFNGAYANYSYSFSYKGGNTTLLLDVYMRSVNASAGTFYTSYFCSGEYCNLVANNPSVFNGQGSFGIPSPFPATGTNGLNFLNNNTEEFNGADVTANTPATVPAGIFNTFELTTGGDTTWYDSLSGLVIQALFTNQGFTGVTGAEPPLDVILLATNVPTTVVPGSSTYTYSAASSSSTHSSSSAMGSTVTTITGPPPPQGSPLLDEVGIVAVAVVLVAILGLLLKRRPKPTA